MFAESITCIINENIKSILRFIDFISKLSNRTKGRQVKLFEINFRRSAFSAYLEIKASLQYSVRHEICFCNLEGII